jgi:hypothetical protein
MYGQLLRRMDRANGITYAVVGPTRCVAPMLRVPTPVRDLLRIRVFEVTVSGDVVERF